MKTVEVVDEDAEGRGSNRLWWRADRDVVRKELELEGVGALAASVERDL